ncbi:putative membrane protein [Desulfurella amilsii]|uniref:Putative membrane protein n=1 Tax=Desulfurella amilsii TaxID=1562698 RepID=A0A1X4XZY4_9BACT|nr:DUF445 family protein [Desulfurella amilsii]OSS43080.1 putative membrane protein [Desulfurella amilsii]
MNDKKKIANLFLLGSIIVFIAFHLFNSQNVLVYIIQKASEAAVVGGFADWFAVSALFKHPLGLKIPHTNIIENNRQKLIDSIAKTVSDTWLSKKYLAIQINNIDPSAIVLNLSKKHRYIAALKKIAKKYTTKIIAFAYTKQFDSMLQKYIDNYIYKLNFYDIFKNNAQNLFKSSLYDEAYKALSMQAKHYILNLNSEKLVQFAIKYLDSDIKTKLSPILKNALENNFDKLIEDLCDYVVLLINRNKDTISIYIEEFIESYKNKAISKDIVITLLEGFNIIDKEALSQELIEQLKRLILEIKQNQTHSIRLNIKNYAISQIYTYEPKLYTYVLELIQYELEQNVTKIKNFFLKQIDDPNTSQKIAYWLNLAINSNLALDFYKQNEFKIKMFISANIQNSIKSFVTKNKTIITKKANFEKYFSYIHNYIINQLLQHKYEFDSFVKQKLTYIMRQNHHLIGKTVKNYLNDLKHEQLIYQIESKVGNDLQYIRINGSIVGSIVGFIIAIVSLIIKNFLR